MRIVLIFLFLLLIPSLNAITELKKDLSINSTAAVYGKTVKILDVSSYGVLKVEVDGVRGIVHQGRTETINEMLLEIVDLTIVNEHIEIDLEITVEYKCGDGICNYTESSESCCTDCGCEEGRCIDNICQFDLCIIHLDCEDNNPCTIDRCDGLPKTCHNIEITECETGDDCCPADCNYLNDKDCEFKGECLSDEDCDDDKPCTQDKCVNNTCENTKIEGCALNDKCLSIGQIINETYCSLEGWEEQKGVREKCVNDYECATGICKSERCYKEWDKTLILWLLIAAAAVFGTSYKLHKLYKNE